MCASTMKTVFLCVLVATIYAASAVPVNDNVPENTFKYPRFITFPDGNGVPQNVDLEEPVDTDLLNEITRNPANNLYLLFTRRNHHSAQTLYMDNADSIRNSNFNRNHPTVVVVHGWLSNQDSDINPVIRDAYLNKGDANVIVLDWRRLAISNYITSANGVPAVGRELGRFLQFVMSVTGANLSNLHLVGFSLGAHLVGNAGRELGGRAARVTALDPAGPLWNFNRDAVNPNDAIYVEGIHTDGGYTVGGLGIGTNIGTADFWPNGGISMPGCLTNICNHNNSWRYFAATVSYNHLIANECSGSLQVSLNNCRGREFPMGNDDLRKFGTGTYRGDTRRNYPY